MTTNRLPEIAKKSERLLVDLEQAVRSFARYHKYTLGADLRTQAMLVVRLCHRTWRDRSKQMQWISELIWAIDELKLTIQLASQLHAFKSFGQFEHIIRQTEEVGRCAGGWRQSLHHKSQNSAGHYQQERAQILSGHAASLTTQGANK